MGNRKRLIEIMSKVNNLNESVLDKKTKGMVINEFIKYVNDFLELDEEPKIILDDDEGAASEMKSFGAFFPELKVIKIITKNRNLADILRTLAHEMVHYKQKLEDRLTPNSGDDGSEIENEANATAAIIMRKFGKENPEIFE